MFRQGLQGSNARLDKLVSQHLFQNRRSEQNNHVTRNIFSVTNWTLHTASTFRLHINHVFLVYYALKHFDAETYRT